jgi:hypothetical protein
MVPLNSRVALGLLQFVEDHDALGERIGAFQEVMEVLEQGDVVLAQVLS